MTQAQEPPTQAHFIAIVKERYREYLRERKPAHIADLESRVAKLIETQIVDEKHPLCGGWGDVVDASSTAFSLRQLRFMIMGWGQEESRYFHDSNLLHHIQLAARFYTPLLMPPEPFPNNWWNWQIGFPENLCRLAFFGEGALAPVLRDLFLKAHRYMVDKIWDFHASANRMSTAMSLLGYGVVSGDASYLQKAKEWSEISCQVVQDHLLNPQGFRRDGTYFYHGSRVNLGYGTTHLLDFALATYMLAGTPWQLGGEGMNNSVRTMLDFAQWTIVGKLVDPFITDRGIAAPDDGMGGPASKLLDTALLMAQAKAPRLPEIEAFCVRLLAAGVQPRGETALKLAHAYLDKPTVLLNGAHYYRDAEYAAVCRPTWAASVKMATWRTNAYAGINRFNRKGWHISDGQLILRTSGEEYGDSIYPTMDWERLTGITRADGFQIPHETMGHSWYASGSESPDSSIACCGLDFAIRRPEDQCEIAARKGWFFLQDAIVATGSNIWTTAAVAMETVIRHIVLPPELEQAEFEEGDLEVEFLVGHDCIYILPDKPKIKVYTQWREGHFGEIGDPDPKGRIYRRRYWTALIPHGSGPHTIWGNPKTDGEYSIVYLPMMTLEAAKAWWATKPFEILQKDVLAHRLYDCRKDQTLTVRQWKGSCVEAGRQ